MKIFPQSIISKIEQKEKELPFCKICFETGNTIDNKLIHPCKCDGSIKFVHEKCILKWLIQTDNQPGALVKILEPFNKRKINLERIETRPSREALNAHNFFIDSSGHYKDAKLKQVIVSLEKLGASVRILGSYPSGS